MRQPFADVPREKDTGAMILGNPDSTCPYCQAPATPTYSICGRSVWWHPPVDCCQKRIAHQERIERQIEAKERVDREKRYAAEAEQGHRSRWEDL